MKTLPGFLSILIIALPLYWTVSGAQETEEIQESQVVRQDADAQENGQEDANQQSDAGRVLRLEKVIALDRARLSELKKDLEARQQKFQEVSADLAERDEKLTAMKAQLAQTSGADERQGLQVEIDAYDKKLDIVKSVAVLTFESEKTVREQAEALEEKIRIDQRALDIQTGKVEVPTELPRPAAVAPETQPQGQAVPGLMPGLPGVQRAPGAATTAPAPMILPETAAQIEARNQAEKSEFEAKQAEQAVLSFLDRKAALQEQIDLEKSLLETAKQAKANIDQGVAIRQQELADKIAADAGQAEMRKAQENVDSIGQVQRGVAEEVTTREERLEAFRERMQALQEEQLLVTQEAGRKRKEAEAARKQSIWLDSPLNPLNVLRWAQERGPRILAVLLVVGVLLVLVRLFVQRVARVMVGKGQRERRTSTTRADTLALSFGSAMTVIIVVLGTLMMLQEAGVDVRTILGGAAILGVAIAFGAQNLMRDYFNGFIILIEDQYELTDLVTINNTTGRVERVTLRTTAVRDLQGKLHFIPNGEIKFVTNRSYEWARIVLDVRIAYKESVDQAIDVIMEVARKMCAEPEYKDAVLEDPEMLGVNEFSVFGVVIRLILKTEPDELFKIRREMMRRIKNRFDELGIEIPAVNAVSVGADQVRV